METLTFFFGCFKTLKIHRERRKRKRKKLLAEYDIDNSREYIAYSLKLADSSL
jgi:hypothetical protein